MTDIGHSELQGALETRYARPHWILMTEVKNKTGFDWTRSADAVAFGLYSSRGYEIHIFECKASRADFMSEMRDPSKSEEMVQQADRFYIVAPKGILKSKDLPVDWGLITVARHGDGYRTRIQKQAKPSSVQVPIERPFAASMLVNLNKRIQRFEEDYVSRDSIHREMRKEYEKGISQGKSDCGMGIAENNLERLRRSVAEFEERSGVKIDNWNGGNVGDLFRIMSNVKRDHMAKARLDTYRKQFENIAGALKELGKYVGKSDAERLVEALMGKEKKVDKLPTTW